jgi:hypothetical protein
VRKSIWLLLLLFSLSARAQDGTPEENDLDAESIESAAKPEEKAPAPPEEKPTVKVEENPRLGGEQPAVAEKPSSEVGEKIFDWDQYRDKTEVPHPFAEKGLIRITRDRTYLYRVPEGEPKGAMSVQFGPFNPTQLKNPDDNSGRGNFTDNYQDTSSAPAVLLTKEWHLLTGAIGKLGVRLGSGVFVAQGHGHFSNPANTAKYGSPKETFTFLAFPNSAGVVYRLQFMHHQFIVPYGEGGGIAFAFTEVRDDGKKPRFGGAPATYVAGGAAFDLTVFDYFSRAQLYREYGVTSIYLTAEYRQIIGLGRYDFTGGYANGGFLMEY